MSNRDGHFGGGVLKNRCVEVFKEEEVRFIMFKKSKKSKNPSFLEKVGLLSLDLFFQRSSFLLVA